MRIKSLLSIVLVVLFVLGGKTAFAAPSSTDMEMIRSRFFELRGTILNTTGNRMEHSGLNDADIAFVVDDTGAFVRAQLIQNKRPSMFTLAGCLAMPRFPASAHVNGDEFLSNIADVLYCIDPTQTRSSYNHLAKRRFRVIRQMLKRDPSKPFAVILGNILVCNASSAHTKRLVFARFG